MDCNTCPITVKIEATCIKCREAQVRIQETNKLLRDKSVDTLDALDSAVETIRFIENL